MNDIVVYGATGFVGRLVAGYLASHAPPQLAIALAGRSRDKLERVKADLGRPAQDWPLVVADSGDETALDAMATDAKVIATTVGPYRRDGLKLVDACIANSADYVDLTGEILFAHASITRHDRARANNVRIVHSCGFDSIPSDLGVLLLHDALGELAETTLVVAAMKGGPSGGTLASMKGQIDEATADKALRRIVFDPYSLGGTGPPTRDVTKVRRHKQLGWTGPFVMATYNTRIVRRSHSLLDYGPDFSYRELQRYKDPVTALGSPPASVRSRAASPSDRRARCSTRSSPIPAKGRARRPAKPASSAWRSTAPATRRRSPPRATPATPRPP